mmetsp:Transcript_61930/g.191935  ORF Transcript_61930/g.191935 Transcript_61930/m.191935 type:complete len:232 (-) Transcript_61930:105-800(-)
MALYSKLAAVLALAVAAQGSAGQDDLVSMIQREVGNTPPPPRPRPKRIHLPDQATVQLKMRSTVEDVQKETDRVMQTFISEDMAHQVKLREQEAEDKAKHHAKELRREQEQKEKFDRLHEKKVTTWADHDATVEEKKTKREAEKVSRQVKVKQVSHAREEESAKADHDMKEKDYVDRNAQRDEKAATRDANLKSRLGIKEVERTKIAEDEEARATKEADVLSGAVKEDFRL